MNNPKATRHVLTMGLKWAILWALIIIMTQTLQDKGWLQAAVTILSFAGFLIDLLLIFIFGKEHIIALVLTMIMVIVFVPMFKSTSDFALYVVVMMFYTFFAFIGTLVVVTIQMWKDSRKEITGA
jgi:hypothetical protein